MKKMLVNIKTFFIMFKQLMAILEKKQRVQCVFLLVGVFVCAMMETLGIGAVVPFVLVLLSPEETMQNEIVKYISDLFGVTTYMQLLIITALIIVAVYLLKNVMLLIFQYFQAKFHNEIEKYLMIKQFRMFMLRPYSYYLKTNSSEVIRGISSDITQVAQVIDGFTGFLSEGITIVMIGIFIVIMDPLIAIGLVGTVMLVAFIVVFALKKKTSSLGIECRDIFLQRSKTTLEAVNGYKEISIAHKKEYFINRFEKINERAAKLNTQYLIIMKAPSRVVETVFIASLLGLACLRIGMGGDNNQFISVISAMAVSAMRLLPSISSLSNYMNTLIYNRVGLEATYKNVEQTRNEEKLCISREEKEVENDFTGNFSNIILKDVSFIYENSDKKILDKVSLNIERNTSVAFVGESGAGKSTLLDVLLGLLIAGEGEISLDGTPIKDIPQRWSDLVGYVPQSVFLLDDTVRRNIAFGIADEDIDDERIWKVIREAQLEDFINSLPEKLDTEVGERGVRFSGGQCQRIAIARALYHNPNILVLDEATSALDTETEKEVMSAVEKLHGKMTIIIVAHRLSTIENCEKVYEVKNGAVKLKSK